MTSVQYEIFDDLLIGIHEGHAARRLGTGPALSRLQPWVAKYGDNGRAHTLKELREYHWSYFRRDPAEYLRIGWTPASSSRSRRRRPRRCAPGWRELGLLPHREGRVLVGSRAALRSSAGSDRQLDGERGPLSRRAAHSDAASCATTICLAM